MKCRFLITLEYPELLDLGGPDVQQWLEERLDGKISNFGGFRITSQVSAPDRMVMHCQFEVSHFRTITEKTMRDWLASSPPYFFVRMVKRPAREGW